MTLRLRFWTADKAWGLLAIAIGAVAFMVKANLLPPAIHFSLPAPMVHLGPFLLIAAGILWLWAQKRAAQSSSTNDGERK